MEENGNLPRGSLFGVCLGIPDDMAHQDQLVCFWVCLFMPSVGKQMEHLGWRDTVDTQHMSDTYIQNIVNTKLMIIIFIHGDNITLHAPLGQWSGRSLHGIDIIGNNRTIQLIKRNKRMNTPTQLKIVSPTKTRCKRRETYRIMGKQAPAPDANQLRQDTNTLTYINYFFLVGQVTCGRKERTPSPTHPRDKHIETCRPTLTVRKIKDFGKIYGMENRNKNKNGVCLGIRNDMAHPDQFVCLGVCLDIPDDMAHQDQFVCFWVCLFMPFGRQTDGTPWLETTCPRTIRTKGEGLREVGHLTSHEYY